MKSLIVIYYALVCFLSVAANAAPKVDENSAITEILEAYFDKGSGTYLLKVNYNWTFSTHAGVTTVPTSSTWVWGTPQLGFYEFISTTRGPSSQFEFLSSPYRGHDSGELRVGARNAVMDLSNLRLTYRKLNATETRLLGAAIEGGLIQAHKNLLTNFLAVDRVYRIGTTGEYLVVATPLDGRSGHETYQFFRGKPGQMVKMKTDVGVDNTGGRARWDFSTFSVAVEWQESLRRNRYQSINIGFNPRIDVKDIYEGREVQKDTLILDPVSVVPWTFLQSLGIPGVSHIPTPFDLIEKNSIGIDVRTGNISVSVDIEREEFPNLSPVTGKGGRVCGPVLAAIAELLSRQSR